MHEAPFRVVGILCGFFFLFSCSPETREKDGREIRSFEWLGEQIPYPDARTEEERRLIGPDPEGWFDDGVIAIRGDSYPMTWADDIEDARENLMFPGYRFGGPAFVNFGKNHAHARDDFVYAVSAEQWDRGDHLRLGRVPKDQIPDRGSWQFVSSLNTDLQFSGSWEKNSPHYRSHVRRFKLTLEP